MSMDIYRRLARRLSAALPSFPPTESGVELELLAKLYSFQEARLASAMPRIAIAP